MNARDYMEGIRSQRTDLYVLHSRIQRIEGLLTLHGIDLERDHVGGADSMEDRISDLIEVRERLQEAEREFLDSEDEAAYVLGAIEDPIGKRAVSMRYLDGMSYSAIARCIGFANKSSAYRACERTIAEMDVWIGAVISQYREEKQRKATLNVK